ncbi:Hypothetical predicted protein [Mytilus galloprovincialis]|uniref:Reverse transcriptase domain-containing protein n=1 Tax=Mytilus galloprovincialis TaxID=29158 RepID=A0A8B6HEC1_MYTGA|nr:Hypothetical predicted protein [Mytilus galloprovincialis]
MHTEKYKICLQKTFPVLHNIKRLDGIIYLISDDLKEDFCFHPDIIELKKKARKEIALMINHMTLPKILHGITQIDATDNSEDWIPNLIDEMQIMNDMVYTMRINEKNTYGFPSMSRYNVEAYQIVLIGNTKDVQWFFSALSESKMVEPSMVELVMWPHCRLVKERLSGLVCITGVNLERYHNQLVDITTFKSKEIVTITRDETTVPDMLEGTILVDARGTDCKWISDMIDWFHRLMSTVYILGFKNEKSLYGHPRYESIGMSREFNAYDEDNDDDGLILLMGNSEEVQQFYTTLLKSQIEKGSKLILQSVPTGRIHNDTIKSVICIVAKSSKDEDFVSSLLIENLECWPNNVVTLVREQSSVPNILLKTKQIVDTGHDDMWLSDVMDEINRTMSMVYAFEIRKRRPTGGYLYDKYHAQLSLIIGSFKDIQWLHSALSKSTLIQRRPLMHLRLNHITSTIIQSIICIVGKTSPEGYLLNLNIQNYECWPNNVFTVVRDTIKIPEIMGGTHKIVVDDRDEKWLSDVLHVIERSSIPQRVEIVRPQFYDKNECKEWKPPIGKSDEITKGNYLIKTPFFSIQNTTQTTTHTITRLVPRPGEKMDSSRIKSIRAENRAAVMKFFKKLDELNTDLEMDIDIAGPIIDAIVKKQKNDKLNTEKQNIKEFSSTSITYEDGKYVAKLSWIDECPELPTNEMIARARTHRVVNRLNQEPKLFKIYGNIIKEQEKRGFIEKIEENEDEPQRIHYIPHHPGKKAYTTTPIRIVYDCSCKENAKSPSLNDCLHSYSPISNDITELLTRFRTQKFAVTTDIEKAFLQVGLHKSDRDVTRFFWLSDPTDSTSPFTTYRFKSVLFGPTCSPFILNATLLKHFGENPSPTASRITQDLFLDNVLTSFTAEDDLMQFYRDSRCLLQKGGFNLRSWNSNSNRLRELADTENVLDSSKEM